MVGHGGSSAGSYLADPTSPIPSHRVSIVATSTLIVKTLHELMLFSCGYCALNCVEMLYIRTHYDYDEIHKPLARDAWLMVC